MMKCIIWKIRSEEIITKKVKIGKNPDLDTSFLPDNERTEK